MTETPPGGPPPPEEPWSQPGSPPPQPPGYPPPQPGWGQPPPPGSQPPPGYQPYPQRRTEGTAIGALIAAIVSFVFCPVIPAIVALVLASNARKKIAESGGMLEGETLCTVAVIISWVNIGLAVLAGILIVILALVGAWDDEAALGLVSLLS